MHQTQSRLIQGEVRQVLTTLPSKSVHCAVTSPPYWGMRQYETGRWVGELPASPNIEPCKHELVGQTRDHYRQGDNNSKVEHAPQLIGGNGRCQHCPAVWVDEQYGLEETFDEFLEKIRKWSTELRRVVRDDGTLWVNFADSYNSARTTGTFGDQSRHGYQLHGNGRPTMENLDSKDLIPQSHLVAMALQEEGWIWRDTIIWFKPNAKPASWKDRTTPCFEYLFMFSKKPRYFYDWFGIQDVIADGVVAKIQDLLPDLQALTIEGDVIEGQLALNAYKELDQLSKLLSGGFRASDKSQAKKRKRNVWIINTFAYPGAHFATFPPDLVKPIITAGTSEWGCCAKCGKPYERDLDREKVKIDKGQRKHADTPGAVLSETSTLRTGEMFRYYHKGWVKACKCEFPEVTKVVPATVLDPFNGSGTTGLMCAIMSRNYIGIDLGQEYIDQSKQRISAEMALFNSLEVTSYDEIIAANPALAVPF